MREGALKEYEDEVSELEHAAQLETYDQLLGTFSDFAPLIIQYGYTTMFISAFPLAR